MKPRCRTGDRLLHRYNRELSRIVGAEYATPGMRYQAERAKRAWTEHQMRCRICLGLK